MNVGLHRLTGSSEGAAGQGLVASLLLFGLVFVGVAVVEFVQVLSQDSPQKYVASYFPAIAVIYFLGGVAAWYRRPANRFGEVLVLGGLAWLAAGLNNTGIDGLVSVGQIVATVPLAVILHLMHVLPTGRVKDRASRATVIAAYLVALVGQIPNYTMVRLPGALWMAGLHRSPAPCD